MSGLEATQAWRKTKTIIWGEEEEKAGEAGLPRPLVHFGPRNAGVWGGPPPQPSSFSPPSRGVRCIGSGGGLQRHHAFHFYPEHEPERSMASYQYIFVMKNLSKVYPGGREILKDLTLAFLPGAKIGVLGPNGAGKSTVLRIMAGLDTDIGGEAWAAEGVRVGYLSQEPELDPAKDVMGNIMDGVGPLKTLLDRFEEVSAKFAEVSDDDEMNALIAEQGELQEKIDAADGWDLQRQVEIAMDALRCPAGDADVTKLSGGERRRVALCRLLLSRPDMLLLDEPTNHLDAESVGWLERFLHEYPGTVVAVTHDRYFLDNVAGWILEIDRGRGIPYEGNYSTYLENKQKRLEQESREEGARQKVIARELEWIRQSPKARQAKSKARVSAYESLVAEAGMQKQEMAQIVIPVAERLGGVVIEAEGLCKGFGDRLLIDDLSFRLPPGGIVGVIGANGAGKTTLFRMITGQDTPDKGLIRVGETVRLGYVDQSRDALDATKTVWQEISDGLDELELGKRKIPSRAYVGQFNFKGADQQKKVGLLSGGERNRVHLAKMLKSGANVLLLDEPTNDLDVETLRALEEALLEFAGCAVVISHDRWFLDRIATHILAFEGDSHVEWFEGNFESYEEDKKRRLGADADQPHRIKYKPLSR
ncbi:ABC transporter component [Pararhodospirillum photometricum DSM 122]|uniref:Energy-dependent translational throttle protein EttA n=2 Tax=Pararhodospirillum photometricum TaxID=1084 RepID=H6SPY0_PARPM|nr:ABC transporter component [Pararhodospirillum photometricum DSM 122]